MTEENETAFVLPAVEGLKVRNPHTGGHLPPEGARVPLTGYWRRRLRTGDVVPGAEPKAAAQSKKER